MTLPKTMTAVAISQPGGPEVLTPEERHVPRPGHGQILIKVAFAGLNRPDALQRAGSYAPPPGASDLPGLEASGTVAALGEGTTGWAVGDAVCALLPGGGYAEYVVTSAAHALPVPRGMTMDRAACLPETYFTVWTNVFMRGGLQAGERFLVHGGSSGIGTTAIQLGHVFGARVFATAGSDEKCAACTDLGAECAINYRDEDFVEVLRDAGGGEPDPRHGRRRLSAAQRRARWPTTGGWCRSPFCKGPKVELNFAEVMVRRLTITGSTLRPQSVLTKARIAEALRATVWPLLDSGRVGPVMDSEFALADAARAHARLESSDHIGKIVLKVG